MNYTVLWAVGMLAISKPANVFDTTFPAYDRFIQIEKTAYLSIANGGTTRCILSGLMVANHVSPIQSLENRLDPDSNNIVRIFSVHDSVQLLANWRRDSNGCESLRTVETAHWLVDSEIIVGKTIRNVREMLGEPNSQYGQQLFLGNLRREGTFTVYKYYIDGICQNGEPLGRDKCWLELIIDPSSGIVVQSDIGCT